MGSFERLKGNGFFKPVVLDKNPQTWRDIGQDALRLTKDGLGYDFDTILFGTTDNILCYADLRDAFCSQETIVVGLFDQRGVNKLIGYVLSMPIRIMNPARKSDDDTGYLYYIVIDEAHRGNKLVGKLMEPLIARFAQQGYSFVELDARSEGEDGGFADIVRRHYGDSIVDMQEHEDFGKPETFFRIDLSKYQQMQTGNLT